jgi:hypothetical protein
MHEMNWVQNIVKQYNPRGKSEGDLLEWKSVGELRSKTES